MLADGTVLLESERDANGCYKGGAGMDGMYLQSGRLYVSVCGDDGQIKAFRDVKPSVRDSLRQCQEDAEKSQERAAPTSHNPER